MPNGNDPIKSIRQALAGGYRKPEPSVVDSFVDNLWKTKEALDYLKIKRGLTEDTIRNFKLGYCAERNAVSIPVYKGGELVNIRYRSLDPNTSVRYTQEKGCEVWLYNDDGIERGKAKKGVLIVEGEFDLMSAWQAGFKNVVSPSSGKDSYGPWIELLDAIPKVYIAYDNDKAGKQASLQMAERVGVDKSYEVLYPEGIKDANDFFMQKTADDFRSIIKEAQPYYKHKFSGVGDILDGLMEKTEERLQLDTVPFVKWKSDWLAILSADSNGGKTTYALNIANELVNKDIPTLFLPFERGIKEVGERYLQVRYNKQEDDLATLEDYEYQEMKNDAVNLPFYFSVPSKETFEDTLRRAKRLFGIKFVVIDHLDYFIHGQHWVQEQADMVRKFKELCMELDIMMVVIHHIAKPKDSKRRRKVTKEDLKGSSAIYQIAEVVILMYPGSDNDMVIDVVKNKGKQGQRHCKVDMSTGKFMKPVDITDEEMARYQREAEEAWNG